MDVDVLEGNCGIVELSGLKPNGSLKDFLQEFSDTYLHEKEYGNNKCTLLYGMIIFSDIVPRGKGKSAGQKLAAFIGNEDLGSITASPIAKNPNSDNRIQAWMWVPNRKFFKQFPPE